MRMEPTPLEVRHLVVRTFQRLGLMIHATDELCETVRFSPFGSPGRTYAALDFLAEWIRDEGILRFFDEAGDLVHCINLWSHGGPQRAAA